MGQPGGYQGCEGTGVFWEIQAGLLLRSVGYKGVALADIPFDERKAVIPNEAGRVLDAPGGRPVPGEYVAGWIKRGPTGIIGTNKKDASETVASVLADAQGILAEGAIPDPAAAIEHALEARGARFVTVKDWRRLDAAECARGKPLDRPRVKFVRVAEMLGAIEQG